MEPCFDAINISILKRFARDNLIVQLEEVSKQIHRKLKYHIVFLAYWLFIWEQYIGFLCQEIPKV